MTMSTPTQITSLFLTDLSNNETKITVSQLFSTPEATVANPYSNLNVCTCQEITFAHYTGLYSNYNYMVIICALPPLAVFGLLSNMINAFIYTRPSMRHSESGSSNAYLAGLATSDFFVITLAALVFWLDSARSYLTEALYDAPRWSVHILPLAYMAQTCSIYFTVAAAMDCYVSVCWMRWKTWCCTLRRAKQVIAFITSVCVLYNVLRFGQFSIEQCVLPLPTSAGNTSSSAVNSTAAIKNYTKPTLAICPTELYHAVNTVYNVYLYMVLLTFLPFALLSLLNALIVIRVKKGPVPNIDSNTVITMVMVVLLFLCCNTLALVINILEQMGALDSITANYLTDTSNFLIILNASLNFVIYMVFAQDYRNLFCYYFCCAKRPRTHTSDAVTRQTQLLNSSQPLKDVQEASALLHQHSYKKHEQSKSDHLQMAHKDKNHFAGFEEAFIYADDQAVHDNGWPPLNDADRPPALDLEGENGIKSRYFHEDDIQPKHVYV